MLDMINKNNTGHAPVRILGLHPVHTLKQQKYIGREMEKRFRLCHHGVMRMRCPLCKDDIKDRRINLLVADESNIGKELRD